MLSEAKLRSERQQKVPRLAGVALEVKRLLSKKTSVGRKHEPSEDNSLKRLAPGGSN